MDGDQNSEADLVRDLHAGVFNDSSGTGLASSTAEVLRPSSGVPPRVMEEKVGLPAQRAGQSSYSREGDRSSTWGAETSMDFGSTTTLPRGLRSRRPKPPG